MLHHIHKHKKKHRLKNDFLDIVLYFFVFTTPLFELPQAVIIYSNKSADGVSALTWSYFAISSLVWLIYGFRKKLTPVIWAYSFYIVIETIVVIGILKYS